MEVNSSKLGTIFQDDNILIINIGSSKIYYNALMSLNLTEEELNLLLYEYTVNNEIYGEY